MGAEVLIVPAVLAVVWIGILVLRVPTLPAFLSLLIGGLISSEVSLSISSSTATEIGLLVLPLAVTIFILRGRSPKSKLMMEFMPALAVAIVLVLFLYPSVNELRNGLDMVTNDKIADYRPWLLISSSILVLVNSLLAYPKSHDSKHHK